MAGLLFPVSGPITSDYGWRTGVNPLSPRDFHTGIDLGVPLGTPIYATHSGVFKTEQNYGGGLMLEVWGGGGWESVYAHTSRAAVSAGTYVKRGQLIGYSGMSGAGVTGPHVHYELKYKGQSVNPRYANPVDLPFGLGNLGFTYNGTQAQAAQQQQLLSLNEQHRLAALADAQWQDQRSKGILSEFRDIAKSQQAPRPYGIDKVPARSNRLISAGKRPSRFET